MVSPWIGLSRGTAQPFIYFDSLPLLSSFGGTLNGSALGPGGVWVRSQAFVSTAPPDIFIGFAIERGDINLNGSIPLATGSIVSISTRDLTVNLQIAQAPNDNAPFSTLTVPTITVFKFPASTGGRLDLSQSVTFNVFGTSLELNYLIPSPAEYDAVLGRVNFPFGVASSPPIFQTPQGSTSLVDFVSTTTPIHRAMWSFKTAAALADSSTLSGAGGAVLDLGPGIRASPRVYGQGAPPIHCGPSHLLVEPNRVLLASTGPGTVFGKYRIPLPQRSAIAANGNNGNVAYSFECQEATQWWTLTASATASLDQPRTVNGEITTVNGTGTIAVAQNTAQGSPRFSFGLTPKVVPPEQLAATSRTYALKNLLLKARAPSSLMVNATLLDGAVQSGSLSLTSDLSYVLPILPDPYATTASIDLKRANTPNDLGPMVVNWNWNANQSVGIEVNLPNGALRQVLWSANEPNDYIDDSAGANLLKEMEGQFDGTLGGKVDGPTMLDLSSNASQFGVVFDISSLESSLKVEDLYLQAPMNVQNVITLPTVEWEPVITAEQNPLQPFPTPFDFPHSGPPGRLGANTVSLVSITPERALMGVLDAYDALSPNPAVAEFGLPCGVVAFSKLVRLPISSLLFPSPTLSIIQPSFPHLGLSGAIQLGIRAATSGGIFSTHPRPPALPGAAVMLKFKPSVAPSADPALSILGKVGTVRDFNDDFGPTASAARGRHGPIVPVNRADISGYGLSMFSEWQDPFPVLPANEKIDIEVLVGRTERQVIQQAYRCVHHGAKITRVVTMQRQNSGSIYRTSVLKAASDGVYQFDDPGIVTHPGLIKGYTNIRNVRDASGEPVVLSDGSTLSPVLYDADVNIFTGGAGGSITTVAINHKGFIVTGDGHAATGAPPAGPVPFGPAQYQEFLTKHGTEVGGPIDCVIPLSGLVIKLTSIGVDFSIRGSNPEFVVCPRTMAEFQGKGEWSFLQLSDFADAQYVDSSGVPLVREGPSTVAAAPSTPFRFAYPSDLLTRRSGMDFCILHTTGSQRVLFPRPKIEANGLNQITSDRVPHLADPFALAYSSGPFPKLQTCIPFEDPATLPANYNLQIDSHGYLKLNILQATFVTPVAQRVFQDSDAASVVVDTTSDATKRSEVSLAIDSASPRPWDLKITNINLINQSGDRSNRREVTRLSGTVVCSPDTPPKMTDATFSVGGALGPVFEVLAFLQNLGPTPPLEISLTNDWSFYVGVKYGVDKFLERVEAGIKDVLKKVFQTLEVGVESNVRTLASTTTLTVLVVFNIPSPWPPLKFIVGASFRLVMATSNNVGFERIPPAPSAVNTALPPPATQGGVTVELGLGAGLAVDFSVLTFKAEGSALLTQSVIFNTESGNWGLGTSIILRAEVVLIPETISAGISVEAKMMVLFINCVRPRPPNPGGRPAQKTTWCVAQVTIGVHVSLFLILNIEFEAQVQWQTRLNGGPCELEEFSGLGI